MKGLKVFTVIALSVLTVVGWVTLFTGEVDQVVSYESDISTADKYVEQGLYQRAILKYKSAIAQNNDEKNWTKLFKAYELRYAEDPKIASSYIEDLNYALKLYPKNVDYIRKLYELYMSADNLSSAYACLNNAIVAGVKEKDILENAQKLKYSYEIDYKVYSDFNNLCSSSYLVCKDNLWGYIKADGDELSDFVYSFAGPLSAGNVRVLETKLGSRLFDGNGMVLGIFDFTVSAAGVYADGLIPAANDKGAYGYYDSFAKEVYGGYQYAGSFQNGTAAVKKEGKWYLINTAGKTVSDAFADIVVDDNGFYMTGAVMIAAKKAGQYQIFDANGKAVSDFSADKMDRSISNGWIAFEKNGKWGYVNTEGKVVIEPTYEKAKSFSNGLAAVCKNGKWGFINVKNELVIDHVFYDADYFNNKGKCMILGNEADTNAKRYWQLLELNFGI